MDDELLSMNDISYDGVPANSTILYNPSFGKICTGE